MVNYREDPFCSCYVKLLADKWMNRQTLGIYITCLADVTIQSNIMKHHYECVVLCDANRLQKQFCNSSLAAPCQKKVGLSAKFFSLLQHSHPGLRQCSGGVYICLTTHTSHMPEQRKMLGLDRRGKQRLCRLVTQTSSIIM